MDTNSMPNASTYELSNEEVRIADDYWTEERMANAIPFPLPSLTEEEFEKIRTAPNSNSSEPSQSVESSDSSDESPVDLVGGTPTRANVDERPFWNGGKLFFTDGKTDYSGSADFCGTNRMLLTAAHCVRNGETGEWYKNFVFHRAYKNGGGQKVTIKKIGVKEWWTNPPVGVDRYAYDYSFLVTNQESGAGWLGWQTGIPYNSFTAVGYPSNYESGKYMQKVVGEKGVIAGNIVQMTGNPMGHGCSGGAWICIPIQNWAIGLNSFRYDAEPNNMYGPYFDQNFVELYDYMKQFQLVEV